MTRKSISLRIYRAILTVSVISMIAMVVTVMLVNEDLESTMLEVEFAQERDFILMNHTGDDVLQWESPNLAVVFVPNDKPRPAVLPRVFRGLPDNYSEEIELEGETYLITIRTVDTGLLYVAKNITHFEKRETLFQLALVFIALIIIALSFLLALLSSRRIVRPLTLLSERISRIPVGANMPRMETDYVDAELNSIATTFNRFLDELESYVRREQSLLSLASHELRTPIAVMSGALDILEVRDQLNPNDRATLTRVRRSCDEMRDNVDILLKLARREQGNQVREIFDIITTAQQVIDDLKVSLHAADRVTLDARGALTVNSDPTMVRMLLRNLIQNAIQHTKGNIRVTISAGIVEIEDQGTGLTTTQQAILRGEKNLSADGLMLSGLGLYIVTLMAERLGWGLEIAQTDTIGTRIRLTPEGAVTDWQS
ncbi:HAMP domain-containing sensor histidine kinase [Pusillimonas sp. ANT_WB101]|uniref:sensor histidine kinase n=1 Tax=Pusillimonas sp. ANT_WB101 TaxID=2597356 RepID=UPI0011F01898|nr:HAMP domain-containing sensor histidine kinase [Pusillimonas sp. ANT_WB101]KAA0910339.1 HAMP domain-containing histidine kinase [Pusillimonas sp. ANT_WB101]